MWSWLATPAQRQRALLSLVLCIGIIVLLAIAWTALIPFFLGLIVAYLLLPMVNFLDRHAPALLRRRGIARPLAILLVYIAVLALTGGLVAFFVPVVSKQASILTAAAPHFWDRIQGLLTYDVKSLLERIPPEIQNTVNANLQQAAGTLMGALQRGLVVTITTVSQTVSFVLGMVIIPFWLFLVLNNEAKARASFFALMPTRVREDVRCIAHVMDEMLGAYLRGQILLCVLVGLMATIYLGILGVDTAVLLGTFAGILEIIPILGPYLGAIPAVLVALTIRPVLALWVAVGFFGIQQIENIFLVPRISGSAVRFHPAIVMVIVVIASQVAGLWGLVLGVPVAAMLRDVFRYLYLRTTDQGTTPQRALEALRSGR